MNKEIEVKFLNINITNIRKYIKENNGKRIHKFHFFKRYTFDLLPNDNRKGFIRIREEYNKTTLTLKTYDSSKFANESEIILKSSLEETKIFLINLGYNVKSYQESIREKWSLKECHEIAIDIIPGLPSYIELECKSENAAKSVAKLLNLDYNKVEYDNYAKFYNDYYGVDKNDINKNIPSLTFKHINNELSSYIKKNKDLLQKIQKKQNEFIKKHYLN
jgi:adenylate cyclase class IV